MLTTTDCLVILAIIFLKIYFQPGTAIQLILTEKAFPEPRLIIFHDEGKEDGHALIVSENSILIELDSFSICESILYLVATYYVFHISYPKSCPAASILLFIQEILLGEEDTHAKKTAKYKSLANFILSA